jgi:N-acetylglucosaminyl-diphospho-decaprenol L-rhamnosyltransferase
MTLSVIIVNYKNPALLRLSLTTLARALGRTIPCEVIVVDSGSTIETQNVVRADCSGLFEQLTLVPFSENTGYTHGVNEGLRRTTGEYILILNPDIVVLPGAVESMIDHLREHPHIGLLGPGLLNFDGTHQDSCFRFYTPWLIAARRISWLPLAGRSVQRFLMHDCDLSGPQPVDWLMGSALMTHRAALERVGMMDERFFHYMSDVDWARSFWENDYQVVYYPNVHMHHYHQRQSKGRLGIFDIFFQQQTRWHIRDALRYFRKHGITSKRPALVPSSQPNLFT